MSALLDQLLGAAGLAQAAPLVAGLLATLASLLAVLAVSTSARAYLEHRTDRVAAGPIFALSGVITLGACLVWASIDLVLGALGKLLLEERLLVALTRLDPASLEARLALPEGGRLLLPGALRLPLTVLFASLVYLGALLWLGRTLAELVSLEQKPADVLARERAEQERAIQKALEEGRPLPAEAPKTIPLSDDAFGRLFKLLGHHADVEIVEERFVRWQRPLLGTLFFGLALSLPSALAGDLAPALWAGAALTADGFRRNLRTRIGERPEPPAKPAAEAPAMPPPFPSVVPLLEEVHRRAGVRPISASVSEASGARIAPGTDLAAKRVLEDLGRELDLSDGLYVHQGLALDALAAGESVLLATPPLSGKQTTLDLAVFYALLVETRAVLYVARGREEAAAAEARFQERARRARWHWNLHAQNLAAGAPKVDVRTEAPSLVFVDPPSLHAELLRKQADYGGFLGALGLVVVPDLDRKDGAAGAHLAQLFRRLRRAARAASALPGALAEAEGPAGAEETGAGALRFLATAAPCYRDLGRFAERIAGRPFRLLGPEVDGAPRPSSIAYGIAGAGLRDEDQGEGLAPAVFALGEALAQGFSAELFGFADVLAREDVARANEVMLSRGKATRARADAIGSARFGASSEDLARAEVAIARASAESYASLPRLTSHLGLRAAALPPARLASLGAGERVGAVGIAAPAPPEGGLEGVEGGEAGGGEGAAAAQDDGQRDAAQGEALSVVGRGQAGLVLVLWQPDLDPLSMLLARELPPPSHPDLRLGCALALDPSLESVGRAHLAAALAEREIPVEELERDFSPALVASELARLALPEVSRQSGLTLTRRRVRRLDPARGEPRDVELASLSGRGDAHAGLELDATGAASAVVDRHTGEVLFHVERERALAAAYPGRIFVSRGRRFAVAASAEEARKDPQGPVLCEREERTLSTTKVRTLSLDPVERREGERRSEPSRAGAGRRTGALNHLGGEPFVLEVREVRLRERVLGLRRHGPDGRERDLTLYAEPVEAAYATRASVLSLPEAGFGAVPDAALHALCHLFRTALPAFVRHAEDELDVAWLRFGDPASPSIAFVDARPGGAGFADAVTLEVVRHLVRWSIAILRRCPGCAAREGCPRCLRIQRCHAEPEQASLLDRAGADRILSLLVGEPKARLYGPPVAQSPPSPAPS